MIKVLSCPALPAAWLATWTRQPSSGGCAVETQGFLPKLIIVVSRQFRTAPGCSGAKPQLRARVCMSQSASSVPLDRGRGVGYTGGMATVMVTTDRASGRVLSRRTLTPVPVRSSRRARNATFTRDPQGIGAGTGTAYHRSPVNVTPQEIRRQIAADLDINRSNRIHKKASR